MKKLVLFTILNLISIPLFSQTVQNDSLTVNIKNAEKGYIIDNNNKKIESYVVLMGNKNNPWNNQRVVKAIAVDKVDKTTDKIKLTKYFYSDLHGYGTATRKFELIDFANVQASLKQSRTGESSSVFDVMNATKNLVKQKHLAELIVDGKYKVYRLYAYPKNVDIQAGQQAIDEKKDEMDALRNKPSLIYKVGNEKIKFVRLKDFETIAQNCKSVLTKIKNGGYDALGYSQTKKKSGLVGKLMKVAEDNSLDNSYNQELIITFFNDLNSCN